MTSHFENGTDPITCCHKEILGVITEENKVSFLTKLSNIFNWLIKNRDKNIIKKNQNIKNEGKR